MKKILPALVLGSLLVTLLIPIAASAQVSGPGECCKIRRTFELEGETFAKDAIVGPSLLSASECPAGAVNKATPKWGIACLINTLNAVVDWIFVILIAVAVLMVTLGAIQFITSAGRPEMTSSGRQYMIYALVGLILAFLARALPGLFKLVAGY